MKSTISSGIVCLVFFSLSSFGQQTSADQAPTQQQPPPAQQPPPTSVPGTPSTPKPQVELPPTVPRQTPTPPQERDTGGDAFSIEVAYWMTTSPPTMWGGAADTTFLDGNLRFNGDRRYSLVGVLTIPTGHENSLEFTYFRNQGAGNQFLGVNTDYFGSPFYAGDQLFTGYTTQSAKLSWNYLTWPYPSNGAKLRIKTLWEVQFVNISAGFNAPNDLDTSPGTGSQFLVLPSLGLGVEYHPAKHLRLEMKASGFTIPHHADVWDAQASAVLRFGRMEYFLSYKAYHFKTSPQGSQYFSDDLFGPYIGVRYMFK